MANLTLDMMLAYNNRNKISTIKLSILLNNCACERFACLFETDDCDDDIRQQAIMTYILKRYANMRGTYFVGHLKKNSGNQIAKLASSQATRAKVASAVVSAKLMKDLCVRETGGDMEDDNGIPVAVDSTPECRALWESAEECVFELADKEEEECDDNDE